MSTAILSEAPRRRARGVGRRVGDWIPAALLLVLGLVAWQEAIRVFHIQRFLLPKPTTIASTLWTQHPTLFHAGWF
ncbi:MAG: hypothetical protein ACR2MU_04515, partial [Gaiellaceae bacterium]